MGELSPIDKLDSVLKFICKSDFWITGNPEKYIYGKYNQKHNGIIAEPEFIKILDRLAKDGYLEKAIGILEAYEYALTFDGMVFDQTGGYRQKQINENAENIQVETLELFQKAIANRMFYLTVILTVAALIAALYYLTELYWKYHWFH